MLLEKIYASISSIIVDGLGCITIIIHQLNVLELETSLWTQYLRSGTGALRPNESNLHIWPSNIQTMARLDQHVITTSYINRMQIHDAQCFEFVNEYLNKLNKIQYELQKRLQLKKKKFPYYSININAFLQAFTEDHTQSLRLQYEYEIKMVDFNYREQVLDHAFQQQNLNQQQVNHNSSLCCVILFYLTLSLSL
jgi:hypothetical protein